MREQMRESKREGIRESKKIRERRKEYTLMMNGMSG